MSLFEEDIRGAEFSVDRTNRFALWRIWNKERPNVAFIGLNPSKADETKDDPTIGKVVKIAKYNNFGGVYMLNLYSFIATEPEELKNGVTYHDTNTYWLNKITKECWWTVFAWGSFKEAISQAKIVIPTVKNPYCIIQNKNGSPKHPLYCLDRSTLIPYLIK